MKLKMLALIVILLVCLTSALKLTTGEKILVFGEFIDHISGWLLTPGAYEEDSVYEMGNGPGAIIVEIQNFNWADPYTTLIIYIIYDEHDGSTNEAWAGGYVDYRCFSVQYPYVGIKYIGVLYYNYYGGGSEIPSVSYYGFCNCYGYEGQP